MAEDHTPHGHGAHVQQLPLGTPGRRRSDELSPREEEVLQLIADGLAPNEVAERLYISPRTVKNHLASAYAKLGARDRTDAVLRAVRRGIVHL
ncbi:MAG TPA: response regulator transcription factor [Acidimicrobiales bacterium]|jgi:DNA-binding NarL/FixJ family response regulator|nr:response regulator transcription factor [Acidimicrobiales bacterium]